MKDDTIILRVSKELKKDLQGEANLFDMKLSQYVRHFISQSRFNNLPKNGE
jgi:hypothetical protein